MPLNPNPYGGWSWRLFPHEKRWLRDRNGAAWLEPLWQFHFKCPTHSKRISFKIHYQIFSNFKILKYLVNIFFEISCFFYKNSLIPCKWFVYNGLPTLLIRSPWLGGNYTCLQIWRSKYETQQGQIFEFFLFDFLGNSDQVEEKIRDCGERLYNANSKIGSAIFVANRDL